MPFVRSIDCSEQCTILSFLVITFGLSSWIAVNGLWVELPLFVNRLPEGWALPSYLVIVIQLSNICPLLYGFLHKKYPARFHEVPAIVIVLLIGVLSGILLIFLWDKTMYIGVVLHSVPLLILAFLLASVDCTSSLVYLPYMARFKHRYIIILFIGESLSGLIPSVVSFIQGAGDFSCQNVTVCNMSSITVPPEIQTTSSYANITSPPSELGSGLTEGPSFPLCDYEMRKVSEPVLFSVEAFFGVLVVLTLASLFAFLGITNLSFVQGERERISTTRHRDVPQFPDLPEYTLRRTNSESSLLQFSLDAQNFDGGYVVDAASIGGVDVYDIFDSQPQSAQLDSDKLARPRSKSLLVETQNDSNHSTYGTLTPPFSSQPERQPLLSDDIHIDAASPSLKLRSRRLYFRESFDYYGLLFCMGLLCFLANGFLPSFQSYAVLPYGQTAYHLVVRLAVAVSPLMCLSALFIHLRKPTLVYFLTFFAVCCATYSTIVASQSPKPWFQNLWLGPFLVGFSWLAFTGAVSFTKVSIAAILRHDTRKLTSEGGHNALFWCGAVTQLGSFLGAVTSFSLVNFANFVHSAPSDC